MKYDFNWKAVFAGLIFLFAGGFQLFGILQAQSWMETEAVMDQAKIVTQRSSSGTSFRLDVTYHWEHAGKTYTGHEFSMDGILVEASRSELEAEASTWLHARHVKCMMNPRRPEQAVLMTSPPLDGQIVMMVLGVLLLLWGAAWPVWVVRRSLRADFHRLFPAEGYAMAGMSLVMGATMGGLIFEEWSSRQEVQSWMKTPCVVLESRMVRFQGESRPLIRYTWDFKDQKHEGQQISACTYKGSILDAEELMGRLPAGRQSVCWVNPNSPGQAVLERDPPLYGWTWCLGIAAIMGGCMWRFSACWKQWRVSRSMGSEQDFSSLPDEELPEEPALTHDVEDQLSGLKRRGSFLTSIAAIPWLFGLVCIVFPCLAIFIWLLPVARREMQYSLWLTPAQLIGVCAGSFLLAVLVLMARRWWKS